MLILIRALIFRPHFNYLCLLEKLLEKLWHTLRPTTAEIEKKSKYLELAMECLKCRLFITSVPNVHINTYIEIAR